MTMMMTKLFFVFLCGTYARNIDELDLEVESNTMLKILRDMATQTKADTLNLPANASSIRENITDTFSCENRTYGYYADVDNDCQVFHICLPTQLPSGRAVTYRYSFICPNETVFNQEVMVCTRPIDAIDCEDSPLYYDLNQEIGKVPNNTDENASETTEKKETQMVIPTVPKRKEDKRKQNIVIENLIKEVVNEELKDRLQEFVEQHSDVMPVEMPEINSEDIQEVVVENEPKYEDIEDAFPITDDDVEGRIAMERSMKNVGRGAFRFRADV
ncbi:uncharacterized protein LOC115439799 [Manduca sexta]|uniref:Chitin-binding type-2 domain-containing protein n=1 Tax=Manduca sexta TaxID=7130 RepID=A0A921YRT3_MANSE|nr:uncharacterized protein LOC115439799 [Manduca sexta]KAG6444327.1 hypothetical protein O3G_MSEX003342 [Manduca sexta]